MKTWFIACLLFPILALAQNYPVTKKTPVVVIKHGTTVNDDYSWLENMRSPEVNKWVDAQNSITNTHINFLSGKIFPLPVLKKYHNKTSYSVPTKRGAYFYANMRDIDEEVQTATFGYKKTIDANYVELINPNFFYSNKTVNVIDYQPSKNSKILAYKLMIDGSDQHEVRFVTIQSGKKHSEIIHNVKFGDLEWKGDDGVFYNKNSNTSQFALDSTYQIYYHKIGTPVTNDKLIFDATESRGQFKYFTSEDGKKLFLSTADKDESHLDHYYADLDMEPLVLKKFPEQAGIYFTLRGYRDGKLYIKTGEANWGDLKYFEIENPKEIKVLIPQYQNQLLLGTTFFENRILAKYKNIDGNYFMLFDYNGNVIKKIQTPKGMDVDLAGSDYYAKDIFFSVSSYTIPPILFTLNIETGAYDRFVNSSYAKTTAPFPIDYFETKTTTYTTRDGMQVPITIVYKKGIALNGDNPTLLEAYGGFGTISSPHYDNGIVYFLNSGGVYAYAEIRGGGDKGKQWHRQGKGLKKINTINDFIDAAEYLIKEKYTCANKLAITGGSQGGLLVGAAMVKRPELFKVAIPRVGVFDMAKFNQYTVARFHLDEYGDPEIKSEFEAMMDYSPYHNIKEDVNYPTTLIITSDNDDRVPPVHSYKFAARLQDRSAQKNPVYLQTRRNAGHYGITTNPDEMLKEESEFYSFLLYHLNK
jgi:prolyl oligopeptidase